jgi:hypothetical protein
MWIQRFISTCVVIGATLLVSGAARAAEPPSVKQALSLPPQNSDVDYDMPDAKLYDQCKVAPHRDGKATGWIVTGPAGQPLRRFMDTNGDDIVDQFSYFKNGLEVYRDIDSNFNKKKDQFRWFNTGGMRWGIDANEDGKIDAWKQISAEEVSRIAVRALVTKDETLLIPLLVTKADLRQLGIKGPLEAKLLASVADPRAKIEKAVAKSKIIQPGSTWIRFDAAPPAAVPADTNKTSDDLVVYENVMAIVDYGNPMAPGLVHIGELIRVGEVWKMTSLPLPMEGSSVELAPGLVLNEPLLNTPGASPAVATAVSPKVQEAVERLQKLMENPPPPGSARPVFEKYQKELEGVLAGLINESKTDEEREQWTRQLLDALAAAVQSGADPTGISRLKKLESEIVKAAPKSPLVAIARYRVMVAEFGVAMHDAEDNEARQKVHDRWLTELNDFLDAHPKADDAPDAALQLAVALEFAGKLEKAKTWYERIVKDYAESPAGARAEGALKRIDLAGKPLALGGPSFSGGNVDIKQFRGKLVCVFFWDTSSNLCLEDLPVLKGLYEAHHAQGFEIVGVNLDSVKGAVGPYLAQHGVKWPQIYEPGGLESALAKEYGIIALPTMFIVDGDGKVLNRGATVADLKTTLAEKLAKK